MRGGLGAWNQTCNNGWMGWMGGWVMRLSLEYSQSMSAGTYNGWGFGGDNMSELRASSPHAPPPPPHPSGGEEK